MKYTEAQIDQAWRNLLAVTYTSSHVGCDDLVEATILDRSITELMELRKWKEKVMPFLEMQLINLNASGLCTEDIKHLTELIKGGL